MQIVTEVDRPKAMFQKVVVVTRVSKCYPVTYETYVYAPKNCATPYKCVNLEETQNSFDVADMVHRKWVQIAAMRQLPNFDEGMEGGSSRPGGYCLSRPAPGVFDKDS